MRSDARRVEHAEGKEKKKKKETKVIRPCGELKQTESHIRPFCVSSRVSKKHRKERPST